MPRLSLYRPNRTSDYQFLDRTISEMYTVGGLDIYVHKYLGPQIGDTGNNDATLPVYDQQNPLFIEDLLLLENRDRKYDPNVTFSSWKIDSVSDPDVLSSRHLSFMIFLNDDDNAYVKFAHQRVSIKSQKGLIVLYPSGWTFANMSTPSDKPLYVITGHVSVADKVKNKPKTDIEFTQFQFNDFEYNTEGQ